MRQLKPKCNSGSNRNAGPDSITNTNCHPRSYRHAYANNNRHAKTHADADANANRHAKTHADSNTNCHAKTHADPTAVHGPGGRGSRSRCRPDIYDNRLGDGILL